MPPTISNIQGLELSGLDPTVSLDFSLNRGGFTCGQILEHSEEEWTGKTTLVFEATAEFQHRLRAGTR